MADGVCAAQVCMGGDGGTAGSATGAPVQVGDGCGDEDPSSQSFRFALCSCSDYVSEFPLIVDGVGEDGGDAPAASVGVNGSLTLGAGAQIGGSLQVAGMI